MIAIPTALSCLFRSLALASVLLLIGGAVRWARERLPAIKRLDPWRLAKGLIAVLALILSSEAVGLRDWLEELGSLEVSQGPGRELLQKASLLGLPRELRRVTTAWGDQALEVFQFAEDALAARRYREGAEGYGHAVRAVPTAAGFLNLGIVWLSLDDFRSAEEAFHAGLRIARREGDTRRVGACVDGLGRAALGQGRLKEALASHEAALGEHTDGGNILGRAMAHANIANVYFQQGRLDEALIAHHEAFALRTRTGNLMGRANAPDHLGEVYRRLGRLDEAWRAC